MSKNRAKPIEIRKSVGMQIVYPTAGPYTLGAFSVIQLHGIILSTASLRETATSFSRLFRPKRKEV
jgi:hypothetical protein